MRISYHVPNSGMPSIVPSSRTTALGKSAVRHYGLKQWQLRAVHNSKDNGTLYRYPTQTPRVISTQILTKLGSGNSLEGTIFDVYQFIIQTGTSLPSAKNSLISFAHLCHAGSVSGRMWLLLSSGTNFAPGMLAARLLPSSK